MCTGYAEMRQGLVIDIKNAAFYKIRNKKSTAATSDLVFQ